MNGFCEKSQFAGLNDKRDYFSDGICSLPYGHSLLLNEIRNEKKYMLHAHSS